MQPCGVIGEKLFFSRSGDQCAANWCTNFNCSLAVRVRVWGWVMVEFGTSSAFRGWVRVLGYGFGVRGKVKSRDCALASDLVRADLVTLFHTGTPQISIINVIHYNLRQNSHILELSKSEISSFDPL